MNEITDGHFCLQNHMYTTIWRQKGHDPAEEAVIQLLRTVAWGAGIEHVSGDDQYVNVPVADRIRQPIEEGGKGFVAPAPVEGAPDMPVGRMQYS